MQSQVESEVEVLVGRYESELKVLDQQLEALATRVEGLAAARAAKVSGAAPVQHHSFAFLLMRASLFYRRITSLSGEL